MLLTLISITLYVAVLLVAGVRVQRTHLSSFELGRLVAAGDETAKKLHAREYLIDHILRLKLLLHVLLSVLFIMSIAAGGFGWVLGPIVSFGALLSVEALAHRPWVASLSSRLYSRGEHYVLLVAERLAPALKHFASHDLPIDFRLYSQDELLHLIDQSGHILNRSQQQVLRGALQFHDRNVASIMTPRGVIEAASKSETLGPVLLDRLYKTGHSRFPVYETDIDHMSGMLYIHDLVDAGKRAKKVSEAMEPKVYYIRDDQLLQHALAAFLRTHHHLFIVVNEFRETVGLLSLEDVLETLIGHEIRDEFDAHDDLREVAKRNPKKNNLPSRKEDV